MFHNDKLRDRRADLRMRKPRPEGTAQSLPASTTLTCLAHCTRPRQVSSFKVLKSKVERALARSRFQVSSFKLWKLEVDAGLAEREVSSFKLWKLEVDAGLAERGVSSFKFQVVEVGSAGASRSVRSY